MTSQSDYYLYGKVLREYVNGRQEKYLTTQHERDQETGLDYRGARYYDSDVARFLSLDPLATKFASWSAYNYVLGNPVSITDPSGRSATNYEDDQGNYLGNDGRKTADTRVINKSQWEAIRGVKSNWSGERFNARGAADLYLHSSAKDAPQGATGGMSPTKSPFTFNIEENETQEYTDPFFTIKTTNFSRVSRGDGPLNLTVANGHEMTVSYEAKLGNFKAETELPYGATSLGFTTTGGASYSVGSHPQDGLVYSSSQAVGKTTTGTTVAVAPGKGTVALVIALAIMSTGQVELLPLAIP